MSSASKFASRHPKLTLGAIFIGAALIASGSNSRPIPANPTQNTSQSEISKAITQQDTSPVEAFRACDEKELSRICKSCNLATVRFQNKECGIDTRDIEDLSCTSGCPPQVQEPVVEVPPAPEPIYTPPPVYVPPTASSGCNCNLTCEQITSCAEAQYQLNACGCSRRDNDKDGIACDNAPLNCQ